MESKWKHDEIKVVVLRGIPCCDVVCTVQSRYEIRYSQMTVTDIV